MLRYLFTHIDILYKDEDGIERSKRCRTYPDAIYALTHHITSSDFQYACMFFIESLAVVSKSNVVEPLDECEKEFDDYNQLLDFLNEQQNTCPRWSWRR